MAQYSTAGVQVDYVSTLGAAKSMTAVSNATSAVATLEASHGVAANEYVLFATSGWSLLQGRIARASAVSTNDVTFAGLDTSSTTLYGAGLGTGTVQEVTWASLGSIAAKDVAVAGGDPNYAETTLLGSFVDTEIVTTLSAYKITIPIVWDPAASPVANLVSFTQLQTATGIRFRHPAGPIICMGAKLVYKQLPQFDGGVWKSTVVATLTGEPMVYTS